MKDPPPTSTSRVTLYVLRDEQQVQTVTGIGGIAGVYFGRRPGRPRSPAASRNETAGTSMAERSFSTNICIT